MAVTLKIAACYAEDGGSMFSSALVLAYQTTWCNILVGSRLHATSSFLFYAVKKHLQRLLSSGM
jgi:hypothetical protein